MIRTSYKNTLDYSDIFKTILFGREIKNVVEIGLLDGFSLETLSKNTSPSTRINAYDIFDEFNGNHASFEFLIDKFKDDKKVSIQYGDFYSLCETFEDKSIDVLHVDIANNGNVIKFIFENYMSKLSDSAILIIEGGSEERDNVEWMIKYEKPKIKPVLDEYKEQYNIMTIGTIPSITVIAKKI